MDGIQGLVGLEPNQQASEFTMPQLTASGEERRGAAASSSRSGPFRRWGRLDGVGDVIWRREGVPGFRRGARVMMVVMGDMGADGDRSRRWGKGSARTGVHEAGGGG